MADSGAAGRGGRGEGRSGGRGGGDREGGFKGGFGRGRGRGDKKGGGRGDKKGPPKEHWTPVTKLGRLVDRGKIKSIEEIYLHALPIKEYQIVEKFLPTLKDEVLKIMPVQKQTTAGQRTRFKAFVVVGDFAGHIGLGVKCSKEVATAIRGAIIMAKIQVITVRLGYWGNKVGQPHTVPVKVTGKCGSCRIRLVPAPRGSGVTAAKTPKKLLLMAGVKDVYTSTHGSTRTMGNFAKATFQALYLTFGFLTPDMWPQTKFVKTPYQEHANFLIKGGDHKPRHAEHDEEEGDHRRGGDRGDRRRRD